MSESPEEGIAPVIAVGGAGFCALALVWLVHPALRELPTVREIDPDGLRRPAS